MMDPKEEVIRGLYDARSRRDWDAVRRLLADEVGWHEPGDVDHSGEYRGREDVIALLQRLVTVTDGTFDLAPEAFLNAADHSAVLVRWWAERDGRRCEGNDIPVYRFRDGKISQVWFYDDGYDLETFSAVFAFD